MKELVILGVLATMAGIGLGLLGSVCYNIYRFLKGE